MTDVNDIIGDGTDGIGDASAGSGAPAGRTTSDAAKEAETIAASTGSKPADSQESAGDPVSGDPVSGNPVSGDPPESPANDATAAEVLEGDLDELGAALAERDEYKDLALRAKADFENYRKRADKRVAETRAVAVAAVIRELLPVIDNLDRAVDAAGAVTGGDAFGEGVRLVHQDLHTILDRLGLVQIDPAGEQFDPNFHEAISQGPAPEGTAAGTVLEVVQKGFTLGAVVVRPARVVVAA